MDVPEGLVPTEKPQLDSRVVKFPHALSDASSVRGRRWLFCLICRSSRIKDGHLLTAFNRDINRKCVPEIDLPICSLRIDLI